MRKRAREAATDRGRCCVDYGGPVVRTRSTTSIVVGAYNMVSYNSGRQNAQSPDGSLNLESLASYKRAVMDHRT